MTGSRSISRRKNLRPVAQFTIPTWILLAFTILVPFIYGIYISFQNINLASFLPPSFVGFENYRTALAAPETWSTLRITLLITFFGLLFQIPLGIVLALALHENLKGAKIFRSILITPMLLTPVAVGLTYRFMFDTDLGVINWFLDIFGVEKVNWLGSQTSALLAVIIVDSWQSVPFVMLLVLAALTAISPSLYEAARVDGANSRQIFRRLTLQIGRAHV